MRPTTMKAMLCPVYGAPEVLTPRELPIPTPNDSQVLIKVKAATVTAGDCELRRFQITPLFWLPVRLYFGIFKPRKKMAIMGQEYAGEIVEVGSAVTGYKVGDAVFGLAGLGSGAYVEYRLHTNLKGMARKPKGVSFAAAATIPTGGLNAVHFIRMAKIKPGDKVLINGAGGSIGTYGVQVAKHHGAEVTAVDSADKLEMLKTIGADHVIDYKKIDYRDNGKQYDVIFDVVGQDWSSARLSSLKEGGRYVGANPTFSMVMRSWWNRIKGNKKTIRTGLAGETVEDFRTLTELYESGDLQAVIDREFELEDLVEAHTYVDTGRKAGNVIINVNGANEK